MSRETLETMPDVMDAKQLADVLRISKAGAYNLLNSPDFPTLRIGGRKLVIKQDLLDWLRSHTNEKGYIRGQELGKKDALRQRYYFLCRSLNFFISDYLFAALLRYTN